MTIIKIKEYILTHRFITLVISAIIGIFLAWLANNELKDCYPLFTSNERFFSSFLLIILSLPTLIALWFFRTHDTQESIRKIEESTKTNILFNAQRLLFDENKQVKVIGLLQLLQLKRQGYFRYEVDISTRNIDLVGTDLTNINLCDADLSNAKLNTFTSVDKEDFEKVNYFETIYNKHTKFPKDFTPSEYSLTLVD